MKDLINRWRIKKWPLGSLAVGLTLALAVGVLLPLVRSTRADPLALPPVMNNLTYSPPSPDPEPEVFGPDLAAWTTYQDHPGYAGVFTSDLSRKITGDASRNHIYLGSNTLVFMGYDDPLSPDNLDFIFSEEYDQFTSVSFELRPSSMSFRALSRSAFLFNGGVDASNEYTGYMIALEPHPDGLAADLRLYYVAGFPLSDTTALDDYFLDDPPAYTLVSTYATGLTPPLGSAPGTQPVYVRVESTAAGFQVFINGQLRTRDLDPQSTESGFGFFAAYTEDASQEPPELCKVIYSGIRIEAEWEDPPVTTAKVRFLKAGSGYPLEFPDPLNQGQMTEVPDQELDSDDTPDHSVSRYYKITPPTFPGYELVTANQKQLNPIRYFGDPGCNVTELYYVSREDGSYKDASYKGFPDNGTEEFPVLVQRRDQAPVPDDGTGLIDYNIHAGGENCGNYGGPNCDYGPSPGPAPCGCKYYEGEWVMSYSTRGISMRQFGHSGSKSSPDIPLGLHAVSSSGQLTLDSNFPMKVGYMSAMNGNTAGSSRVANAPNNDETVIGFDSGVAMTATGKQTYITDPIANTSPYPYSNLSCGGSYHHIPWVYSNKDGAPYANLALNESGPLHPNDRYIKMTYNNLRLDTSFLIDFIIGGGAHDASTNIDNYWFLVEGRDSRGNPIGVPSGAYGITGLSIYRPIGNKPAGITRLHELTSQGGNPNATILFDQIPLPAEYTDPYNGERYIFPKADGTISITAYRIHNQYHDYTIALAAGQTVARSRGIVLTVEDLLPAGTRYVTGSAGIYEPNLVKPDGSPVDYDAQGRPIIPQVGGRDYIRFDFGVVPPNGYDIPIQVTVENDGLFENHATITYKDSGLPTGQSFPRPPAGPFADGDTNSTWHMTGMTAVTEHFMDIANLDSGNVYNYLAPTAALKDDRNIDIPLGSDYTTSIVSMDNILYNGDTYRYVGYRLVGKGLTTGSGAVIPGEPWFGDPLDPYTYPEVEGEWHIELFFARNPVVSVEFYDIADFDPQNPNPSPTTIKATMTFPVTYADSFYLPDSVREPIPEDPNDPGTVYYNYVAYSKDPGQDIIYFEDPGWFLPEKPVYESVKDDQTIKVYFDKEKFAVTVHYVELGNPTHVLRNIDRYPILQTGGDFRVEDYTPLTLQPDSIYDMVYVYRGYSISNELVDELVNELGYVLGVDISYGYHAGEPPSYLFKNITSNKEITLYYEEGTMHHVTEKFRLWTEWDDPNGQQLRADNEVYVLEGGDFTPQDTKGSLGPLPKITYNNRTYHYIGYSDSADNKREKGDDWDDPLFANVQDDANEIIYLYRALEVHVRQVLLNTNSAVDQPLMGYLDIANGELINRNDLTLRATCLSGPDGQNGISTVQYTNYIIPLDIEEFADKYQVRLIIPQNYAYAGYALDNVDGNHDSKIKDNGGDRILPPSVGNPDDPSNPTNPRVSNGKIMLDFADDDELWLTLYIDPRGGDPGDNSNTYATNDFGEILP